MEALNSVASFFQNTFGSISISSMDHRWLIVGFTALVVLLIIFTQEKPKVISILIAIYGVWFIANLFPAVVSNIQKNISEQDLFAITTILGSLPIVALLVQRYKKGKKRPGTPT